MVLGSKGRWWFQIFFIFTPKIGEDFQFDEHIFQMGWNLQLVYLLWKMVKIIGIFVKFQGGI